MGICYSQQEEWEAYNKQVRQRGRHRKKKKNASIIYEENSIYQNSFASKVENSFREDIHVSIENLASQIGSIAIGSIVEMSQDELKILVDSLAKINPKGQQHKLSEPLVLCNLKTKNFLHTHKVSFPDLPKIHQVSSCPSNSNHIIEYDIWKLIKCVAQEHVLVDSQTNESFNSQTNCSLIEQTQQYFIYHPFTQRFLNYKKGHVVCAEQKKVWSVVSYGPRRNGGFIKISCDEGELCMTDQRGLLTNHRKLDLCKYHHISHLWELKFGEIV